MSEGPDLNPALDPKPDPDASLTLQEVMILKQFIEKATRTEGFFLDTEKKPMAFLRTKLDNLIAAAMALNETSA